MYIPQYLPINVADVRSLDSNKKNGLNDQCSHVNHSKCSKSKQTPLFAPLATILVSLCLYPSRDIKCPSQLFATNDNHMVCFHVLYYIVL